MAMAHIGAVVAALAALAAAPALGSSQRFTHVATVDLAVPGGAPLLVNNHAGCVCFPSRTYAAALYFIVTNNITQHRDENGVWWQSELAYKWPAGDDDLDVGVRYEAHDSTAAYRAQPALACMGVDHCGYQEPNGALARRISLVQLRDVYYMRVDNDTTASGELNVEHHQCAPGWTDLLLYRPPLALFHSYRRPCGRRVPSVYDTRAYHCDDYAYTLAHGEIVADGCGQCAKAASGERGGAYYCPSTRKCVPFAFLCPDSDGVHCDDPTVTPNGGYVHDGVCPEPDPCVAVDQCNEEYFFALAVSAACIWPVFLVCLCVCCGAAMGAACTVDACKKAMPNAPVRYLLCAKLGISLAMLPSLLLYAPGLLLLYYAATSPKVAAMLRQRLYATLACALNLVLSSLVTGALLLGVFVRGHLEKQTNAKLIGTVIGILLGVHMLFDVATVVLALVFVKERGDGPRTVTVAGATGKGVGYGGSGGSGATSRSRQTSQVSYTALGDGDDGDGGA